MNEELFSTYFTEGMRRMIGIILRFNSWISKHCSQYRSDFQHKDFFSVLEQHLFFCSVQFSSVTQSFLTPQPQWTAAHQVSLSITNSQSLPKLVSTESVMPSNHLILCHHLLLLTSIFPNTRVFSNESALCIRWPKYWSFSFNISPSNEHPELISLRMDWLNILAAQETLKSLLQHHSSKASILLRSAFFIVYLYILYTEEKHSWV